MIITFANFNDPRVKNHALHEFIDFVIIITSVFCVIFFKINLFKLIIRMLILNIIL